MKLTSQVLLATAAAGRLTTRSLLDNLGTISFGDDGFTVATPLARVSFKNENNVYSVQSQSVNGNSYNKYVLDIPGRKWTQDSNLNKNDMNEIAYRVY